MDIALTWTSVIRRIITFFVLSYRVKLVEKTNAGNNFGVEYRYRTYLHVKHPLLTLGLLIRARFAVLGSFIDVAGT